MNIVPTEYKLDTKPVNMINASEYEMVEVRSDDNIILNAQNIRIQLKDLSTFTNLYNAYIEVHFRVVKDAHTEAVPALYTADDRIALTNSVASLFSRCVLRLQNNIVEVLDEQHISAIVKGLLLYSDDYTRTTGTNELWFKDTGDCDATATSQLPFSHAQVQLGAADSLKIVENPNYNKGFAKREALCRASQTVVAHIPLSTMFGFCSIDRVITGNLVALEFTKSQATDHLHAGRNADNTAQTADGKVLLDKMSLWCPRIMPSPQIDLELKSAIGGGLVSDYKYAVFNSYVSSTIPDSTNSQNVFKVLTQSEKILQAFVFFRKSGRSQADPKWKTIINDKLSELEVRLNGKTYPARRYSELTTAVGRSRAYLELVKFMNKSTNYDSGIQLSLEEWKNTSIYAFDLRAQPENWSKSPSTLEVVGSFTGNIGIAGNWNVCVVSERHTQINYSGSQPVVNVM